MYKQVHLLFIKKNISVLQEPFALLNTSQVAISHTAESLTSLD